MKKTMLTVLFVWVAITLIQAQNNAPGPGEKAGEKIAERVESAATSSTDQKTLVKEIAEAARQAGKDNPNDPDKVKEAVRKKLDEIRDRKSENGKPGGKNNKEIEEWVKKLKSELMDKGFVELPGSSGASLVCSATGTGRTSGHIANLTLYNPSNIPVTTDFSAVFIPSGGQYQPYIVPAIANVTVPPHTTANVPVEGYCADIFSQPVPAGVSMPPVENWVHITGPNTLSNGWQPVAANGWKPNGNTDALIPGTGNPVGHTIDLNRHQQEVAPLLLDAVNRITEAYDRMKSNGTIDTPFAGNPEKEREAVIQQTFWIYAAALSGKEYTADNFLDNTARQYESNTGQKLSAAPATTRDNIKEGAADFWGTFQAVGVEAKVLAAHQ